MEKQTSNKMQQWSAALNCNLLGPATSGHLQVDADYFSTFQCNFHILHHNSGAKYEDNTGRFPALTGMATNNVFKSASQPAAGGKAKSVIQLTHGNFSLLLCGYYLNKLI